MTVSFDSFSHYGPYGYVDIPLQRRRSSVVRKLTPLLRGVVCVVTRVLDDGGRQNQGRIQLVRGSCMGPS